MGILLTAVLGTVSNESSAAYDALETSTFVVACVAAR